MQTVPCQLRSSISFRWLATPYESSIGGAGSYSPERAEDRKVEADVEIATSQRNIITSLSSVAAPAGFMNDEEL